MKVNNIEISDIILNEIKKLVKNKDYFTTYDIFIILEYFLYQKDISQLLDISKASFYKYKREKKNKFIDRKLYNLYLIITNENFENEIKSCENINLE
jgi:hypothetical protein